jgi:hypothetical protein
MSNKFILKIKRADTAKNLALTLLVFALSFVFACQSATEKNVATPKPTPTPEKKTDDFEGSLASVRTGSFNYVFAFRRPDGDIFSSDDKKFLKANSPNDTNQWVMTGDEKIVIAGSNYKFTPENLTALKKRFTVEDLSPVPSAEESGSSNQNAQAPNVKPPTANANQKTANANN